MILFSMVFGLASMSAQNEIDRMVENYSLIGHSTFTSAVERNPHTRKIVKVVKVLSTADPGAWRFVSVFRKLARSGSSTETRENGRLMMTLATSSARSNRIYMLQTGTGNHTNVKVTIIIKVK